MMIKSKDWKGPNLVLILFKTHCELKECWEKTPKKIKTLTFLIHLNSYCSTTPVHNNTVKGLCDT